MKKANVGIILNCMLLLIYTIEDSESTDDCTGIIRDSDYDYNRRHRYNYNSYNDRMNSTCYGIDLSYVTWILPPARHNLQSLRCINCRLDKLPVELLSYTSLEQLTIVDSFLFNITKDMFKFGLVFTSLSVISSNVSYVQDDSFGSTVKKLNLSSNSIENIFLAQCAASTLDLSFNSLKNASFPSTLRKLYLKNNKLVITEETFAGLHALTFLDISNNDLSFLPDNVFSDLTSLHNLNISHNNLMSLDYGSFSGLHTLTTLDITYNSIETIPEHVFHDVQALIFLYINHNNMTDLDGRMMIENLPHLTEISIGDNRWNCDVLSVLIRTLKSRKITILPGTCKTTLSIVKICCVKSEYSSTTIENSQTSNDVLVPLRNFFNRDFTNSKFYNFFTKDYKQQNFWKYFDTDYQKDSLFRFFDAGFLQSQFYRYFNRDHFNVTFQNRIIDKIEDLSHDGNDLNITGLKDSLKGLFQEFFYSLNSTNAVESFPKNEALIQYGSPYNEVLVAVMATVIILLVVYIVSEKCKCRKKPILDKLNLYHMFKSRSTTASEPEIEIL